MPWLRICGPLQPHPPLVFIACNGDTFTFYYNVYTGHSSISKVLLKKLISRNKLKFSLVVTSLLLTQRARVRSPVGSVSCLRFFLNVRQMSGNLGHIRPRLSYDYHMSSKPYIIRLRTATISNHNCSTWPSLRGQRVEFRSFWSKITFSFYCINLIYII